jgi:hypothetical protein
MNTYNEFCANIQLVQLGLSILPSNDPNVNEFSLWATNEAKKIVERQRQKQAQIMAKICLAQMKKFTR